MLRYLLFGVSQINVVGRIILKMLAEKLPTTFSYAFVEANERSLWGYLAEQWLNEQETAKLTKFSQTSRQQQFILGRVAAKLAVLPKKA